MMGGDQVLGKVQGNRFLQLCEGLGVHLFEPRILVADPTQTGVRRY